MSFKVEFSKRAANDLKKLDSSSQKNIIAGLERIVVRPYDFVRKLMGSKYYRLRVGDYRVIMDIDNETLIIIVITVGHRKNIYKRFKS